MTPNAGPIIHVGDAFELLREAHFTDQIFDHVITDPPYSDRTHRGHAGMANRAALDYEPLSEVRARELATLLDCASAGWIVVCTDHVLGAVFLDAFGSMAHRYTFAPIPAVTLGRSVRTSGDGPPSWTDWLIVSRPRGKRWLGGWSPAGAYFTSGKRARGGGKTAALANELIRDYTRPKDRILDPFAGAGTFGHAAIAMDRRYVGIEKDERIAQGAADRLEEHWRQIKDWRR